MYIKLNLSQLISLAGICVAIIALVYTAPRIYWAQINDAVHDRTKLCGEALLKEPLSAVSIAKLPSVLPVPCKPKLRALKSLQLRYSETGDFVVVLQSPSGLWYAYNVTKKVYQRP
jgi:hypothetical protein